MNETSPIPPGAMLEVGVELIDEGELIKEINAKLRGAFEGLRNYETETGDTGGKATVTVSVSMYRMPGARDLMMIESQVKTALPQRKRVSEAVQKAGKLLCQPVGTNDDPEQQLFYDQKGQVIGGRDAVIDEAGNPVAGTIRRAAQ